MGKKTRKTNGKKQYTPYIYKKEYLEYTTKHATTKSKPCLFSYCQACSILKAIELNERRKLSKNCIAQLAVFVSRAWEENPSQETIQKIYAMINNLLDTTMIDVNQPFDKALQEYCSNTVSTPTLCSNTTLLVAISYIDRLNKRYKELKGNTGCSFRMVMVAFIMASKYIHGHLQLIIYTDKRKAILPKDVEPNSMTNERNIRIARMELEFLHFLNYDLSVQDPVMLVQWARGYDTPDEIQQPIMDYTSADEADDEMDDDDDDS